MNVTIKIIKLSKMQQYSHEFQIWMYKNLEIVSGTCTGTASVLYGLDLNYAIRELASKIIVGVVVAIATTTVVHFSKKLLNKFF